MWIVAEVCPRRAFYLLLLLLDVVYLINCIIKGCLLCVLGCAWVDIVVDDKQCDCDTPEMS